MLKIAIVTTHPIQYNAPFFRELADEEGVNVKVFYTWSQSQIRNFYDPGFNINFEWDIPLLDGYDYEFIENSANKPGSDHFWGVNNSKIITKIKEWEPTQLLIYGWNFYTHLKLIVYFKGKIPVLFRGDSTLIDNKKNGYLKNLSRFVFLRLTYWFIDYALYTGVQNKKYYLKYGLKKTQLIYVPHAIDNLRFSINKENYQKEAIEWRKSLNILPSEFVFMYAGKLESKKNPLLLINAFKKLHTKNCKLILVGNGHLDEELNSICKTDKSIIKLDFQNQSKMPIVYHLCDVFVLPSKGPGETWGLAVNEAMCCEKAVLISNRVGCASDLVKNNNNGKIFESENLESLFHCLNYFITNKEKVVKMGEESYKIINEFTFKIGINNIITELKNPK